MDSWNSRYLTRPPGLTCFYKIKEIRDAYSDSKFQGNRLVDLKNNLEQMKTVLSDVDDYIKKETAYLSNYIYQNGKRRTENYMYSSKKIFRCLKRWKEIALVDVIESFLGLLPELDLKTSSIRLPAPHNINYFLCRLVGMFRLLIRISSLCLEASVYLRSNLLKGHTIGETAGLLAIIARLRILTLDQAKSICKYYDIIAEPLIKLVVLKDESKPGICITQLPLSLSKELPSDAHCKEETFSNGQ